MSWLDLLILALATWYASRVLTKEAGPWGLLAKLRAVWPRGPLTCIYCTAPWAAAALWADYRYGWPPVVWVLAVAGLALMLRSYTGVAHG